MTTTNGQSFRVVLAIGAAEPYVANVPGCCAPDDEPDGAWSKEALKLHWPLGDGRLGVFCCSEDFVSVTFRRDVFEAHEVEGHGLPPVCRDTARGRPITRPRPTSRHGSARGEFASSATRPLTRTTTGTRNGGS